MTERHEVVGQDCAPGEQGELVLPDQVRARVVALVADALGRMPAEHLPASLKRVATFTPARRGRLAASQIASVVALDDEFRGHAAVHVRAALGELGHAVVEGAVPAAADPVDVAAAAYLLRPEGWRETVSVSVAAVSAPGGREQSAQVGAEVERLRAKLERAQGDVRRAKQEGKEALEEVKRENADLRRKLGEARQRVREAEAAQEVAERGRAEDAAAAVATTGALEAEGRRLRFRIGELEAEVAANRRAERSARVGESTRARLLLDTVVEAAASLRRELGLPAVERLPADTVQAHLAEEGARTSTGRGSLPVDDPALLEELLALPRAHLVIDGYNITKNALPDLSLERQRERLLAGVAPLVARTGAEVTVVFDAAESQHRPVVAAPRGVRVLFSPRGVIADDVIRDLVAAEPTGRAVVVASSDQAVVRDVRSAGFRTVASGALAQLLLRQR